MNDVNDLMTPMALIKEITAQYGNSGTDGVNGVNCVNGYVGKTVCRQICLEICLKYALKSFSTKKDAVIQPCHADAPSFEHGKITWGDDTLFFPYIWWGEILCGTGFQDIFTVCQVIR